MGRSILSLHHLLFLSLVIFTLLLNYVHATKKYYIVYLGALTHGPTPSAADLEIATTSHYDLLASILGNEENAKEAIIYSYNKQINGFAAILEEEEAAQIAKNGKVVSVFLTWQKGRFGENAIIANIDTGVWPESMSFSDRGIGPIPTKWRGGNICQINKHNGSTKVPCNRKLIGARFFNNAYGLVKGKLPRSQQTARDFGASLFVNLPPNKSFTVVTSTNAKLANATKRDAQFCRVGTLDLSKVKGKIC
ncbi:unnamed protein product [Vicia faba]|uniref:Inhibitor I9 domain-containing protein n=1 Tax=Vicia faba TaxID=3906 RepID=A0AAV1ASW5_VICFA|nr:unnamed protein product [Vicia faba]